MLEKNEKKMIFDAHFHYFDCKKLEILNFPDNWKGISCAHTKEEWQIQKTSPASVIKTYGIHPQLCGISNIETELLFLEELLKEKSISAIGEMGFDFYTDAFKSFSEKQEQAWIGQLELALKYSMPVIIHCRKGNEKLFEYSKQLSKLPEVLFHSFMGTVNEARSLLNRGINGYFSFGKQVFNNNKKVIECIRQLPYERVLAETDAPFQFLKGEQYTSPMEIVKIQEEITRLQNLTS